MDDVIKAGIEVISDFLHSHVEEKKIDLEMLVTADIVTRDELDEVLGGSEDYSMSTFLKVIRALQLYFYMASKEGKDPNKTHDFEDIIKKGEKTDPYKSND